MNEDMVLSQLRSMEQKVKVLEMLRDGWKIESWDGREVEMRKGFSYKRVRSSGSCYSV